jgi:hypothetical protein
MTEFLTIIFVCIVWMYIGHKWSRLFLKLQNLGKRGFIKNRNSGFIYKNQKCLVSKGGKINKRI